MNAFIYPKIITGDEMKYADLAGQINGSRTIYTIPESYTSGKIFVYYNGIFQTRGDGFTETTSTTITTTFVAVTGEDVVVLYTPA